MRVEPRHEYVFAFDGAAKYVKRNRAPRPGALMPLSLKMTPTAGSAEDYLYSLDPRALRIKEEVTDRLSREFPADKLPSGFAGATAVPGNFYAARSVTGYGMDPLPIPVTNNAALTIKNGLIQKIREEDKPYLDKIIDLLFGAVVPTNLYIRKEASTSWPYYTTSEKYKKAATISALKHIDKFFALAVSDDRSGLEDWLDKFGAAYFYTIQERQSPDGVSVESDGTLVPKGRIAPTEEEARSGSFDGESKADKRVIGSEGQIIEGHFAMRRRDVFAANGIANYVGTAIFGPFRTAYLNRFSFTYKARGRQDKTDKIRKYQYTVGCDVKTMDKMIMRDFVEYVLDRLTRYIREDVVVFLRKMFFSGFVMAPPWRETPADYNPVFGRGPLDTEGDDIWPGLPSGIFINPDFGKLWMTFVYMIVYKDIGAISSPADIEPLLAGQNREHALMDSADDAAFLTNSAYVAKQLASCKSPYAVLEPETPVIYLGDVFIETSNGKEAVPNPITYIVNALAREDSVDRKSPVAWADGQMAREAIYGYTPIYRDMLAIKNEAFKKHLGFEPGYLARQLSMLSPSMSEADAMFRLDPAVIHYKVDPKDVSPDVLNDAVATIPAADFYNDVKHLYKVPTTSYHELETNNGYH